MISPKAKPLRVLIFITPILTFFCTFILCAIVYQSYIGYMPPPINVQNVSGAMVVDEYGTNIDYQRSTTVRIAVTSTVSRRLTCSDNWMHDLPTADHEHPKEVSGKINTHHDRLPFRIPPGTVCIMHTVATYHPPLSLRDHTYPVPDLKMVVTKLK